MIGASEIPLILSVPLTLSVIIGAIYGYLKHANEGFQTFLEEKLLIATILTLVSLVLSGVLSGLLFIIITIILEIMSIAMSFIIGAFMGIQLKSNKSQRTIQEPELHKCP